MDLLQQRLREFDELTWDDTYQNEVNKYFQKLSGELYDADRSDLSKLSNLNREVFAFNKSFRIISDDSNGVIREKIEGLGPMLEGNQTLENGDIVPMVWPDISKYDDSDFEYIQTRFNESSNLYFKSEYGLILYLSGFNRHNDFKYELASILYSLCQNYYQTFLSGNDMYFSIYFRKLESAISIIESNKSDDQFRHLLDKMTDFTFRNFMKIENANLYATRYAIDFINLILTRFKFYKDKFDYTLLFNKVNDICATHTGNRLDASVSIFIMCDRLVKKGIARTEDWMLRIAKAYEALGDNAASENRLSAISYIEQAMKFYSKSITPEESVRIEKKYNDLRGKIALGTTKTAMPDEYVQEVKRKISETIAELSPADVVMFLAEFPMLKSLEEVRKDVELLKSESAFFSMLPSSVMDKFGNTVKKYYSSDEIEEKNLLDTYGLSLQLAMQEVVAFIFEAIQSDKLNPEEIIAFLNSSWLNEPVTRMYNGVPNKVVPLAAIVPGLKFLFEEFALIQREHRISNNIILIVDSLTLKIEYILRFLCERLGIVTFKPVSLKSSTDVVMEKNIDDIFSELSIAKGFPEDDKYFFKYILTEKLGWNMRHRVAHGLIDSDEYNIIDAVGLLLIILRISSYKFTNDEPTAASSHPKIQKVSPGTSD